VSNYRDKAFDQGIDADELARKIVEQLPTASTPSLEEKEDKIKKLKKTIKRLQSSPGDQYKEAAMRALAASNVVEATELLEKSANYHAEESHKLSSQSAQNWLDVGVLAETYDEEKALHAYQRALQLDPENLSGWNYLGLIGLSLNNLEESKRAFDKVLALSGNDKSTQAAAYGNLGLVYMDSDHEKAERYLLKSLEIDTSNGPQGRVANQYINLGLLYERKGTSTRPKSCTANHLIYARISMTNRGWLFQISTLVLFI
jgi:tetratricopeptide (TPR) repeat protein